MTATAETSDGQPPVEETLAWEAQWRPRASAAAFIGAVSGLAGGVVLTAAARGGPDEADGFISMPEALGAAIEGREPTDTSLFVRQADELGDKVAVLSLSTILTTIGVLGALAALTYLYRASRGRNPQLGRVVGWSILAAAAIYPVGHLMGEIGTWVAWSDFKDASDRTAEAARDVTSEGIVPAGRLLEVLGAFALAVAFVLVALNAMRVGLLTRFMGILGMLIGALVVFQLDQPQLVRSIWLVFLGLLFLGRYPGGTPPAWATGRAEPWPTQQQLRERRDAMKAEHAAAEEPAEEGEEAPAEGDYVPGESRRKRKKRH